MDPCKLSDITALLKKHNLWAKKRFGQNFLINRGILEKIIKTAEVTPADTILEIGPGLGVLTQELSKHAKKVVSLELDRNLLPILSKTLKGLDNVEIIQADALKFAPPFKNYKIVANIPYYITSPILNYFLQTQNQPTSITLLVQKEVANKLCMRDGKMSILSLEVMLFGEPKIIAKVSAGSFFPAPKVDSAIIHIKVYQKNDSNFITKDEALKILEIAKKAFSQKRKKLSSTLKIIFPEGIDKNRRPETLSVQEWKILHRSTSLFPV